MKTTRILMLAIMMTIASYASAMSYGQAREKALFLTDKMAYELNLSDEQYEAAYQINLDYLLGVNEPSCLYGNYWTIRNREFENILARWQYTTYINANYFYRPMYWSDNIWHFRVYGRYTNHGLYYRSHPATYGNYRGGHHFDYYSSRSWNKPSYRHNMQTSRMNNGIRESNRRNNANERRYNQNQQQTGNGSRNSWNNNNNRNNNNQSRFGSHDNNGNNNRTSHFNNNTDNNNRSHSNNNNSNQTGTHNQTNNNRGFGHR